MHRTRFDIATWAVLTLLLVWPALLNGGPIMFFDTLAYYNAANAALEQTVGLHTDIFQLRDTHAAPMTGAPATSMTVGTLDDPSPGSTDSSRSIYYALFLLVLFKIGGLWAAPLVQAGMFAAALVAVIRAWLPERPVAGALIGAVTATFTGAPFFTSYMMPDFLSGLAVLAIVRLMLPPAMGLSGALAWAALLLFALISHMSHLLVGIGLFVCALVVVPLARLPVPWLRTGLVMATLCGAILAEMIFGYMVLRNFGTPLMRPPFVAARMIADGPGMAYLDHVCPQVPADAVLDQPLDYDVEPPFELCRYRHRLPQDSLTILWSTDPAVGVYGAATPESRQRIAAQHFDFARGVIAHAPGPQAVASLQRFAEQLMGFSLDEFRYSDLMRSRFEAQLSPALTREIRGTRFFEGVFPLDIVDAISRGLTVASGVALIGITGWAATRTDRRGDPAPDRTRTLWALTALVLLALLGNAAVTGVLSAPHDRYQARIYWLLPLVVGLLWMARSRQHLVTDPPRACG